MGDLYVMIDKQSPEAIVSQYLKIVGAPVLVPYWALGWSQCKWGYQSAQELLDTVNNYTANNIPLDIQWTDIDYMDSYRDFTFDQKSFKNLPDVVTQIHKQNKKFVPIIDAGIAYR